MKRIVAAPLWFLVGWYVGAAAAWALGLGTYVAPFTAVGLTAFVLVDPRGLFWKGHTLADPRSNSRAVGVEETHAA